MGFLVLLVLGIVVGSEMSKEPVPEKDHHRQTA